MDKKSVVFGILVTIGLIAFVGIAFADSEIGDRIVALWFHGDCSNCTGYKYSNLTGVPTNITHNDSFNNFTATQNFSEGINVKILNFTKPEYFFANNLTNTETMPSGSFFQLRFRNVLSNNYLNYNATNSSFTANFSGYYDCGVGINWDASLDGERHVIEVWKNDASAFRVADSYQGAAGVSESAASFPIYLNYGDRINMWGFTTTARVIQGTTNTYFTCLKVG